MFLGSRACRTDGPCLNYGTRTRALSLARLLRMSFILTIISTMLLLDLLWWWRADRLLRRTARRAMIWRLALGAFVGAQVGVLLWVIASRFFDWGGDESLPAWLMAAVFIWHFLVLLPTTALWWLGEAIRGVAAALLRRSAAPPASHAEASSSVLSRREFLGAAAAVAAPPIVTGLATGTAVWQIEQFRVRPLTLAIPSLPLALDGLTIAHVTDVHVGRFTSGPVLKRIIDTTNSLRADLVLMTGDLINHAIADLPAALDMVRQFDARHGVYMCEGNHDLIESREAFESITRASGVPLLINETTDLRIRGQLLQLLGLRWGSAERGASHADHRGDRAIASSMDVLLPLRNPEAFPILLAHHPHAFDVAAANKLPLTLAGHTHGGQLMLTPNVGFGPWMFRYWSGLYQRNHCSLIVSNGVGNWFPLRTNAPAEIVHLTLRAQLQT